MTDAIHIDSAYSDDDRRTALYNGQFFVYSQRQAILSFVEFARGLIDEAFAPLDPQTAQHELPVERFAEILGS